MVWVTLFKGMLEYPQKIATALRGGFFIKRRIYEANLVAVYARPVGAEHVRAALAYWSV